MSRYMRSLSPATLRCVAAALLTAASGCGVQQAVNGTSAAGPVAATTGPQLGYIWSPAEHSLRPILGVLGAAQIGQSVVPAGQYLNAASTGSVVLLQDATGYVLMALPSGTPLRLELAASPTVSQLRLSPRGVSALIFAPGASTATLLTGLSPNGGVGASQALTAPGPILDAAISDSGSAAVLVQQPLGRQVSVLSKTGGASTLATLSAAGGSLSFVAASTANPDDLLIADRGANTLTLVRTVGSTPSAAAIPTGTLLKAPSAVVASANGHWAAVANGGEASVVTVDLTGQTQPQRVACGCQPSIAVGLADDGFFRITGPDATGAVSATIHDPTWVAVATGTPRTLFIPGVAGTSAGSAIATGAAHSTADAGLQKTTTLTLGGH